MYWRAFVALLLSAGVVILPARGLGDGSPPKSANQTTYSLRTSVIGAGGGSSQAGGFKQRGTAAQPTPVGTSTGSNLKLYAGFWKVWEGTATAVEEETPILTDKLYQNYPNPFNPITTIQYSVANPASVELTVFNVRGQTVRCLVNEIKPPGRYAVNWDGTSDRGTQVASGVYFYRIRIGSYNAVKKMVVLK